MLMVSDNNCISDIVQIYMEANENSNVDNDSNNKMEAKVKNIRELYASLIKYTLQFFKESEFNSKYKKSTHSILSKGFVTSGYGFGKDTSIGQALISLGVAEIELGEKRLEFEEKVKETLIKKFEQYINIDINNANHITKNLEKYKKSYEKSKSKLRNLKRKPVTDKTSMKIEKEEAKIIQEKLNFNRLALSSDFKYRMICNETQDSTLVDILNFVKVQRQYHQDCVSKLDGIISDITKIHKSNRWNAIRDHKLGIQAYICKNYIAKASGELNVVMGQKVVIINQETEIEDYWEIIAGDKNGLVPKECIVFERGIAIFDYIAKNNDEISFRVGDEVLIFNKETGRSGWYQGFFNGFIGFFPCNYIKLIPLEYISNSELSEVVPFTRHASEYITATHNSNKSTNSINKNNSIKDKNSKVQIIKKCKTDYNKDIKTIEVEDAKKFYIHKNEVKKAEVSEPSINSQDIDDKKTISSQDIDDKKTISSQEIDDKKIEESFIELNELVMDIKKRYIIPKEELSKDLTSVQAVSDNEKENKIDIDNGASTSQNKPLIRKRTVSMNGAEHIKSLQTKIHTIIEDLDKNVEDILNKDYKVPKAVNQSFDDSKFHNNRTTSPPHDLENPEVSDNLKNPKPEAKSQNDDDVEEAYDYICELLGIKAKDVDNSILDVSQINDISQININNDQLSDVTEEKEMDKKKKFETIILKYIESFVKNSRKLTKVSPYSSKYYNFIEKCIKYLKKITDNTKLLIYFIKADDIKIKYLYSCKDIATSLDSVITYSKTNKNMMQEHSQTLMHNVSYFIELVKGDDINTSPSKVTISSSTSDSSSNVANTTKSSIDTTDSKIIIKDNPKISSLPRTPRPVSTSILNLLPNGNSDDILNRSLNIGSLDRHTSKRIYGSKLRRSDSVRSDKKHRLNYNVVSSGSNENKNPNINLSQENHDMSYFNSEPSFSQIVNFFNLESPEVVNTIHNRNNYIVTNNGHLQLDCILSPVIPESKIENTYETNNRFASFNRNALNNNNFDNNQFGSQDQNGKSLYKAIYIVNLVKKDIEFIYKRINNNNQESQIMCSPQDREILIIISQVVSEIRNTLKLAISRQQEVTDQVLSNMNSNTKFTEEQQWNISFVKYGMELADIVVKLHQYVYNMLHLPSSSVTKAINYENNRVVNNGNNRNRVRFSQPLCTFASTSSYDNEPYNIESESFTNIINGLNDPVKNLINISELKNSEVLSNIHSNLIEQYKKILNMNSSINTFILHA